MRQAIYVPAFKRLDRVTFTAGIKVCPQNLVWDTDVHAEPSCGTRLVVQVALLGHPLRIWEKLTNPRNGTGCGKDLRQRGSSESQKAIPIKGPVKIGQKLMWFLLRGPHLNK